MDTDSEGLAWVGVFTRMVKAIERAFIRVNPCPSVVKFFQLPDLLVEFPFLAATIVPSALVVGGMARGVA